MCWSINDVIFYVSCNTVCRWSMTNRCVMSDKHRFNPAPYNFYTDGQEVSYGTVYAKWLLILQLNNVLFIDTKYVCYNSYTKLSRGH